MQVFLGLSYIAILVVFVTLILLILDKKTKFSNLSHSNKQIIFGIVYGCLAIFGNEFGIDIGGASANTRDAAVLTASFVFGAPAGIIAAIIGSVERFLCVYWGGDYYTRIACSIATLFAGFFGAFLRKYLFENKTPSVFFALINGCITEVFHMLMVFVFCVANTSIETGFAIVQKCSFPMITVNGITVFLSVLVSKLFQNRKFHSKKKKTNALVQKWLSISMFAAFVLTSVFTFIIQYKISKINTKNLLTVNIDDVVSEISDVSDRNLLKITKEVAKEIDNDFNLDLNQLAKKYKVTEIVLVDKNGIVTDSTNTDYIDYDMKSGEQSSEFLCLLDDQESYVQSYQPTSYDNSIFRKFAGVKSSNKGFIQVGYDVQYFQEEIGSEVINIAKNRHIGNNGFIFIVDQKFNIISTRTGYENNKNVTNLKEQSQIIEDEVFTAEFYDIQNYCMYRNCEGYYIFAILPVEEANLSRNILILTMIFIEVLIFVALFILVFFLIKFLVVSNILKINRSLTEIICGNLNESVNVTGTEEFTSLSNDINATVFTLKRYISEAEARINRELEIASLIQESSLPSVSPVISERQDLDIYGSMFAAKEVGGDFYDFYLLDNNHLAFLIADVSGKGITGAMFMMKAKTLIKGFAEQLKDVAQILTKANETLCAENDAEMFVTCFMGILDLQNNTMEFSNAGHNPPLICRKNGKFEYFKQKPGLVLGGIDNFIYTKGKIPFEKGDSIFLYTDGITEATNSQKQLFGEKRLNEILDLLTTKSSEKICCLVKEKVDLFAENTEQSDDITMLCIKTK